MTSFLRSSALSLTAAACLLADVSYTQTTKFTGGTMVDLVRRMAQNPAVGRMGGGFRNVLQDRTLAVYIKGNKMAQVSDPVTTIFDLDAGTITRVNNQTHTYNTQTFDEIRQRAEDAQQHMHPGASAPPAFDVNVQKPGQTRDIGGQTASETIITMTAKTAGPTGQVIVKVDTWVIPADVSSREASDFNKRLAAKFEYGFSGPGMGPAGPGLAAAMKQLASLDGVPVLTDVTITGVSMAMMGPRDGDSAADSKAPFLEMQVQESNFASGSVDDSKFAIPAGYTPEQPRGRRQ